MHDIDSCWLINCIFFFYSIAFRKTSADSIYWITPFILFLLLHMKICIEFRKYTNYCHNIKILPNGIESNQFDFCVKKRHFRNSLTSSVMISFSKPLDSNQMFILRSYNKSRCLHVFKCGLDVAILNVPWYSAYTMFSMEYLLLLNLTFRLNFLHSTETFWQTQRILCNRGYCGQGEDIIHWPKLIVLSLWHVLPKILTRGKKFGN